MDSISKHIQDAEYVAILPLYSFLTIAFVVIISKFLAWRAKRKRVRLFEQSKVEQDRYRKAAVELYRGEQGIAYSAANGYHEAAIQDIARTIQTEAEHMHAERVRNHLV